MAQTDLLVSKGLKDAGYEYVIVDGTSLQASFSAFHTTPAGLHDLLISPILELYCSGNSCESCALLMVNSRWHYSALSFEHIRRLNSSSHMLRRLRAQVVTGSLICVIYVMSCSYWAGNECALLLCRLLEQHAEVGGWQTSGQFHELPFWHESALRLHPRQRCLPPPSTLTQTILYTFCCQDQSHRICSFSG